MHCWYVTGRWQPRDACAPASSRRDLHDAISFIKIGVISSQGLDLSCLGRLREIRAGQRPASDHEQIMASARRQRGLARRFTSRAAGTFERAPGRAAAFGIPAWLEPSGIGPRPVNFHPATSGCACHDNNVLSQDRNSA